MGEKNKFYTFLPINLLKCPGEKAGNGISETLL